MVADGVSADPKAFIVPPAFLVRTWPGAKLSPRHCTDAQYATWLELLQDELLTFGLTGVPTAVTPSVGKIQQHIEQDGGLATAELLTRAIEHANTLNMMYFQVLIGSVDLSGEDEVMDRADIARDYKVGDLRDGRGLRVFIDSFVGKSSYNDQSAVILRFIGAKLAPGWSVGDLREFMESLRADWLKLDSTLRDGAASGAAIGVYNAQLLLSLPHHPPADLQTFVRHHYIELKASSSAALSDPFKLRKALAAHAELLGVPLPRTRKGGGEVLLPLVDGSQEATLPLGVARERERGPGGPKVTYPKATKPDWLNENSNDCSGCDARGCRSNKFALGSFPKGKESCPCVNLKIKMEDVPTWLKFYTKIFRQWSILNPGLRGKGVAMQVMV